MRRIQSLSLLAALGCFVAAPVAADSAAFERLLRLADGSIVNALVFDTKDETGSVLYETNVKKAVDLGAATGEVVGVEGQPEAAAGQND